LVNGADLYRAYDALRPLIGHVPQESILAEQLPVRRALRYVAGLRLPPDVSATDADARVAEVMLELGLEQRADVPIGRLSGGQQKRASIAAELIANPGLFFLDEPTSGLDPGLTRRVTEIVRNLAESGATIVVVSHDVESLETADRILFLGSGGRAGFIGSPREALEYFECDDLAEIYQRVEAEDAAALHRRFLQSEHYRRRVAPELVQAAPREDEVQPAPSWDPIAMISVGARSGASASRQLRIAAARYVDTMLRDRAYLALLLLQAPIIGLFIALVAKATDLQPPPPEAVTQAEALGVPAAKLAAALPVMLAATATWFGAINAARELVKELPIFLRERMAGLRLAPYLASKVAVLAALCMLQTAVLLGVIAAKVDLPGTGAIMWAPLELWITLLLASLAALGLGLLISASVSNANRAQSIVPIVLIPQLIFVGGVGTGTIGQWLSYLTVTHWSVEGMKITSAIPYTSGTSGFGAGDLLARWGALTVMMIVLLGLTAWQVARRRTS
jgi:ABC-type multidrug transport system ATPase subunit